jgi:hypothetical protein
MKQLFCDGKFIFYSLLIISKNELSIVDQHEPAQGDRCKIKCLALWQSLLPALFSFMLGEMRNIREVTTYCDSDNKIPS